MSAPSVQSSSKAAREQEQGLLLPRRDDPQLWGSLPFARSNYGDDIVEKDNDDDDDDDDDTLEASEDSDEAVVHLPNPLFIGHGNPRSGGGENSGHFAKKKATKRTLTEFAYSEKMSDMKGQLAELEARTLPEFVQGEEELIKKYEETMETIDHNTMAELAAIDREYDQEVKAIQEEFELDRIKHKAKVISDLEEKKKQIEIERYVELGAAEPKPTSTRELRGRKKHPAPKPGRGRKKKIEVPQTQLLSNAADIDEDHKAIQSVMQSYGRDRDDATPVKGKKSDKGKQAAPSVAPVGTNSGPHFDSRIEDGKLFYEKLWFHRGQPVFINAQGGVDTAGVISKIANNLVAVRMTDGPTRMCVSISSLQDGSSSIKQRA